jgi:hypothetical protein
MLWKHYDIQNTHVASVLVRQVRLGFSSDSLRPGCHTPEIKFYWPFTKLCVLKFSIDIDVLFYFPINQSINLQEDRLACYWPSSRVHTYQRLRISFAQTLSERWDALLISN